MFRRRETEQTSRRKGFYRGLAIKMLIVALIAFFIFQVSAFAYMTLVVRNEGNYIKAAAGLSGGRFTEFVVHYNVPSGRPPSPEDLSSAIDYSVDPYVLVLTDRFNLTDGFSVDLSGIAAPGSQVKTYIQSSAGSGPSIPVEMTLQPGGSVYKYTPVNPSSPWSLQPSTWDYSIFITVDGAVVIELLITSVSPPAPAPPPDPEPPGRGAQSQEEETAEPSLVVAPTAEPTPTLAPATAAPTATAAPPVQTQEPPPPTAEGSIEPVGQETGEP